MSDRRKRRWIVLDIDYPHGHTMQALINKLDASAPGVWVALLTASKREYEQGTFSWSSETEAWSKLGLPGDQFGYSWETFITCLGHLKKTKKTSRGRIKKVEIRGWREWQDVARTGAGRPQPIPQNPNSEQAKYSKRSKPRKEYDPRQTRGNSAPESRPEIESEIERERKGDSQPRKPPQTVTDLIDRIDLNATQHFPDERAEKDRQLRELRARMDTP